MERGVSCVVLDVRVHTEADEVLDHVVVSPESSLVECSSPRSLLDGMRVPSLLHHLLHVPQRPVHGVLQHLPVKKSLLVLRGSRLSHRGVDVCGATVGHQLREGLRKILEEQLLVFCVLFCPLPEGGVVPNGQIGGQHHQLLCVGIHVLFGSVPFLLLPLEVEEETEVLVVKLQRVPRPRAIESTPRLVTASERVGPRESNNLLVAEPHPIEDVPQVLGSLCSIRQSAYCGAVRSTGGVCPAELEGDLGTSEELNRSTPCSNPQVSEGDLGVCLLDGQEHISDDGQPGIRVIVCLWSESHCRPVAASCAICLAVGASRMPSETYNHRTGISFVRDDLFSDFTL
mmetsp:Transcript_30004/g.58875  ORF Transcript_30004/g.58875 Transcript_30004/m.58875 type:complete len:343 (+) Transcript_30004:736-1764(+)